MTQTVTQASTGNSAVIDLNPTYKQTLLQVTVTSGSSGTNYVQFTLDDPNSGSTITWANLSSAIASSAADGGLGATFSILSPVSGARLLVDTSTTSGVVGTTTLKVLQSVTG